MTDGRTTLTTTVGVIAGVHDRTANSRTNALVSGLTSLTNLNSVMVGVTDLTDGSLAVQTNDTNFTGGESYLSDAVLLCHQLCSCTGRTNELCALTGVKLNIVDNSTDGDA